MATGFKAHGPYMSCGEITGTGAAITISLDFKPIAVKLFNTIENSILFWNAAFADAAGVKIVDSGAGTTDVSTIAANGITPGSAGFIIGADTDLNVNGHRIIWEAYRSFR